jgi:hypothetical protein
MGFLFDLPLILTGPALIAVLAGASVSASIGFARTSFRACFLGGFITRSLTPTGGR